MTRRFAERIAAMASSCSVSFLSSRLSSCAKRQANSRLELSGMPYDEAGHLLGEYDGTGTLIEETVWLGDIPVGTLRSSGSGVSIYYIHTDALNTPPPDHPPERQCGDVVGELMKVLILLSVLVAGVSPTFAAVLPSYVRASQVAAIRTWLDANPQYRLAVDDDWSIQREDA
jgi:hypothetical protein